jgi:PPOX class probable F420-dependent enzyme
MASAKDFSNLKYISLITFRKTGVPVPTPVWLLEDGGLIYVRTDPKSGKAKRLRRIQRVRIAPSDARGKTLGPYVEANARFLEGEDARRIAVLIARKYGTVGTLVGFFNGLRGNHPTAVIEIKLA